MVTKSPDSSADMAQLPVIILPDSCYPDYLCYISKTILNHQKLRLELVPPLRYIHTQMYHFLLPEDLHEEDRDFYRQYRSWLCTAYGDQDSNLAPISRQVGTNSLGRSLLRYGNLEVIGHLPPSGQATYILLN